MSKGNKHRGIRMEDELWAEFQSATSQVGETASEVVRGLVREWIKEHHTNHAAPIIPTPDNCSNDD